jgi:type II secretory pathway component PulM
MSTTAVLAWQPNEQGLAQIIKLLQDSKTGNTAVQQECTRVRIIIVDSK